MRRGPSSLSELEAPLAAEKLGTGITRLKLAAFEAVRTDWP
jgi:hypothetical protein